MTMKIKYDENSVCPKCGEHLYLNMFKKGYRLNCKKCRFKVYPPVEQISPDLLKAFVAQIGDQIDETLSQLFDKHPAAAEYLKR